MDNKERYFQHLKADNGSMEEIDLGKSIYLDEESTRKIISLLLSEHKIEFVTNRACNYRVIS
jgi:hypothetical protein